MKWLNTVAQEDVRNLHWCKTERQFMAMWQLVREAWSSDGESSFAATFHDSYIRLENFRRWYYTASGLPGCIPDNNPIEAHNKLLKGTPDFLGYVVTNQGLKKVLSKELPELLYRASESRTEPRMHWPVTDYNLAFRNTEFMLFQSEFNDQVDMIIYEDGWLSNDIRFLGKPITPSEVERMEQAEHGTLDISYHQREDLVQATKRFHKMRWSFCSEPRNGVDIKCVTCDCHQYFVRRWCYNSAYIQHKQSLLLEAQVIPTTTKNGWRVSEKTRDRQYLAAAKARRKEEQYRREAVDRNDRRITHGSECDVSPNVLTQD
jgi:hypothetical protein